MRSAQQSHAGNSVPAYEIVPLLGAVQVRCPSLPFPPIFASELASSELNWQMSLTGQHAQAAPRYLTFQEALLAIIWTLMFASALPHTDCLHDFGIKSGTDVKLRNWHVFLPRVFRHKDRLRFL